MTNATKWCHATIPAYTPSKKKCKQWIKTSGLYSLTTAWLDPASLAGTKGILVSFFSYTALTDMFKFSAWSCLS